MCLGEGAWGRMGGCWDTMGGIGKQGIGKVKDKSFEEDGQTREVVLTITASAEEVDAAAKAFFKELGQRDVPGFRKGKAPREVLEQGVGVTRTPWAV